MNILEEFNSGFSFQTGEGTIELFHGSKSGIRGPVSPFHSRPGCDFGQGFYLGEKKMQVKGLISSFDGSSYYTVSLDARNLSLLRLNGMAWMLTVTFFRTTKNKEKYPFIYENIMNKVSKADVIIGAIADDKMFAAIESFFNNSITDSEFNECLLMANLGEQYVLKTEKACRAIILSKPTKLDRAEAEKLQRYTSNQKRIIDEKVNAIIERYEDIDIETAVVQRRARNILGSLEKALKLEKANAAQRTHRPGKMAL